MNEGNVSSGLANGRVGMASGSADVGYGPAMGQCVEAQQRQRPMVRATVEVNADRPFESALEAMKNGHRITRLGWNASGQYVEMQRPDKHAKMSAAYAYLKNSSNENVPWVPSQGDMFANDWAVLPR